MKQFTPLEYIYIDIANHYGLDKLTWEERINWVTTWKPLLESIQDADNPILYKKAVRSLRRVQKGLPTNTPVSLDSCWSGGQIMSILMRCEETAKASNMINTGKREDVYTTIKDHMNTTYNLNNTRQDIKDCFMPYWYGSSNEPKRVFGEDTKEYHAFMAILKKDFPGAVKCRELSLRTWNPETLAHSWYRDDGTYVYCPVTDKTKQRINCGSTSFTHIATVNTPTEKGLANAANFIQSLDALIMARMIQTAHSQGYELYGIHDSFWCHPLYMQQTRENYLDIMIDLASKPIMVNWLNSMDNRTRIDHNQTSINKFIDLLKTAEYHLS